MSNEENLFIEANKFQSIAQNSIGGTAEEWLNIAFKLDCISLPRKERIDLLLRKVDEVQRFHVKHVFSRKDVQEMRIIVQIAENTRFWESHLQWLRNDRM